MRVASVIFRHRTGAPNARAFTLIELLVVVALIGALVTLLLIALGRVRDTARQTVCASNLHQVGAGVSDYAIDSFGALPIQYASPTLPFDTFWMRAPGGDLVNLGLVMDRVGSSETFYCPTQTDASSPALAHDSPRNPWRVADAGPLPVGPRDVAVGLNSSFATRARNGARWSLRNFSNKVLFTDFVGVRRWPDGPRFPGGLRQPHNGSGFNRWYGDGSSNWMDLDRIQNARPVTDAAPDETAMKNYFSEMDILQ